MIKIIKPFIFIVASLLTLAGCKSNPEMDNPSGKDDDGKKITSLTFKANLQPFTGTESTAALPREWQKGDRIAVFCKKEGSSKFISYVSAQGDGIFTGSVFDGRIFLTRFN